MTGEEAKWNLIHALRWNDIPEKEALNIAIETLEQTNWTPVCEGFPKTNMACFVSVGKFHITQIAMYSDLMGTISHGIFYQGDVGCDNFDNITQYVEAWMPLPKQYNPESAYDKCPVYINRIKNCQFGSSDCSDCHFEEQFDKPESEVQCMMPREQAIKELLDCRAVYASSPDSYENTLANKLVRAIDRAVEALKHEPKMGHWISHVEHCEINNLRPSGLGSYFWCSECDCGIDAGEWHRNYYNYCPNCGAYMKGEK